MLEKINNERESHLPKMLKTDCEKNYVILKEIEWKTKFQFAKKILQKVLVNIK